MAMTDQDDRLLREIQMMSAAGWRLHQRWPGGADFIQDAPGSGISGGMHILLLVLTLGCWLPVLILVELVSFSRPKLCRLTFTPEGEPRYATIKRPKR
jgi:hypothetical protein